MPVLAAVPFVLVLAQARERVEVRPVVQAPAQAPVQGLALARLLALGQVQPRAQARAPARLVAVLRHLARPRPEPCAFVAAAGRSLRPPRIRLAPARLQRAIAAASSPC